MAKSSMLMEAKGKFTEILNSLDKNDMEYFQTFVFEELIKYDQKCSKSQKLDGDDLDDCKDCVDDPVFLLNSISEDIKQMIPTDAVLPSEKLFLPKVGENSDCLPDVTVHVDEFLYSEEDFENLIEEGRLKSYYCRDCKSRNVEPLIFISHSMSKEALYYIFNTKLPTLDDKIVLDIGSRLGAVLYGAYAYTDARKIIGVEMNEEFCTLQNNIVSKHGLSERVEIINDRVENVPEIVHSADVIILNNAFEFYLPPPAQLQVWKFLKDNLKKGAIVVTRPHLETTFKNLDIDITVENWLEPYSDPEEESPFEEENNGTFCDFAFYRVL